MLSDIRIQGFKAVRDSGVVVLGPLMMFVGRNGSGKSSLVEALQWLQEALRLGLSAATSGRFGSFEELLNRRKLESSQISIALTLDRGPDESRYVLDVSEGKKGNAAVKSETLTRGRTSKAIREIRTEAGKRRITGFPPISEPDKLALGFVKDSRASGAEELLTILERATFLRLSPSAIASREQPTALAHAPLLDDEGRLAAALYENLPTKSKRWVKDKLARVLPDSRGLDVKRLGSSRALYMKEHMTSRGGKKTHDIPSWLLSEGTRRLAVLFTLLATDPKPRLIVIEEVENGLDPWTLDFMLDELKDAVSQGVQVILTSHSPYLLDKLDQDQVTLVTRKDGETKYVPLASLPDDDGAAQVLGPGSLYLFRGPSPIGPKGSA